jgi:hypothetical protein
MKTGRLSLSIALALLFWNFASALPAAAQAPKPITFGKTKTYEHESGLFSIDYPATWKVEDRSDEADGDVVVQFTDKTGYSALRVDIGETSSEWTSAELATQITKLIKDRYKAFKKYSAGAAKKLSDTKAALYFKFEYENTPMTGDAFIEWHGDHLSVVAFIIPAAQYDKNKKAAYASIESFKFIKPIAVETISTLTRFKHSSGVFSIKYPKGWTTDDRSKDGEAIVVFENPDGYSFVMIEVYAREGEDMTEDELIAKLDEVVDSSIGEEVAGYESQDAEGVSDDAATKVFMFTLTDDDGNEIKQVGLMALQEHGALLSYLRIVMPANSWDGNKDALKNIIDSMTVDEEAEF